jgi:hypothetical protein
MFCSTLQSERQGPKTMMKFHSTGDESVAAKRRSQCAGKSGGSGVMKMNHFVWAAFTVVYLLGCNTPIVTTMVSAFGIPPGMGAGGMYGGYSNPESAFLVLIVKISEQSEKRRLRLKQAVYGGRKLMSGHKGPRLLQDEIRQRTEQAAAILAIGTDNNMTTTMTSREKSRNQEGAIKKPNDSPAQAVFTLYANTTDAASSFSTCTTVVSFSDAEGIFVSHALETVRHIMRKFCIISTQQLYHTPGDNLIWKRVMVYQRIQGFLVALVYGSLVYRVLHSFHVHSSAVVPESRPRPQAHNSSIW